MERDRKRLKRYLKSDPNAVEGKWLKMNSLAGVPASDAGTLIEEQLRQKLRTQGINPLQDSQEVRALAKELIANWMRLSAKGQTSALEDAQDLENRLVDTFCGLGPLQPFTEDPKVEEIWINDAGRIFVAKGGKSELTTLILTNQQIQELVERMLRASGRRLDLSSPFVDAALEDGSRLHAVIPPVTSNSWSVNIRRHIKTARRLEELVESGTLTRPAATFLSAAMEGGLNILVSGATQAGKTTLLRALCGSIPAGERIITCEEVFELNLAARDVVAMQTRSANIEGNGEITLRRLVKESLRMRPERLVIGEVREAEALDLLIALNAGIPGACTLHANSAHDALRKLSVLPLLSGPNVTADFVIPTIAGALDLVVHCYRDGQGHRRVAQIVALTGAIEGNVISTTVLFEEKDGYLQRTSTPWSPKKAISNPKLLAQLQAGVA